MRNTLPDFDMVEQLLEQSISKSRKLSHEISPISLHLPLVDALKRLLHQMKEQFDLRVQFSFNAEPKVDDPLKAFILRGVQELLFNIIKHAGVNSAEVLLLVTDDHLTVNVIDQGCGIDPDILVRSSPNLGLGLLSIRERANHIGGRLEIESSPGRGSRLTLTVPVRLGEQDQETGLPADRQLPLWQEP